MIRQVLLLLALVVAIAPSGVRAQERLWLQIEARPTLAQAEARAADYASRFGNVNGFRLSSGWYAIALGPYGVSQAQLELSRLRGIGAIPGDSFIAFDDAFGLQFWPVAGAARVTPQPPAPAPVPTPLPSTQTLAEARDAERLLSRPEREQIQQALQWEGFYTSSIDGAFGPGTRRAMGDWQAAQGFDPTGVLTSLQRRDLIEDYLGQLASLGLATEVNAQAGIEITLPMALVDFARLEAPFAIYEPEGDSGVQVLLISQSGDQNTLFGLYDVLQTLEIMPLEGPRERRRDSFTLTGADARRDTHAYAELRDGTVKGYILVWPAGDTRRRERVLTQMQQSFRALPGAVLPDTAGNPEAQSIDLLAGLEIRAPETAQSGFYVDEQGAVLTAADGLAQCARITLNEEVEMEVAASDIAAGLALLRPRQGLTPIGFARLRADVPRLQSEIAVAGYSYLGLLTAPTLTFGRLADLRGLAGEEALDRLTLTAQPGDAGGPILDGAGRVTGMLLPRSADAARTLPADVAFAADAATLAAFLSDNGIAAAASDQAADIAPEDLTVLAADMTVLVSCWN